MESMGVIFQFPYRTVAEISLGALVKNLYTLRGSSQREVIPVVKANAYGHGMIPVARVLISRGGCHMVAVATLEEAMELRHRLPHRVGILVLSGFVPHQVDAYCRYHLIPIIHSLNHLKSLRGRDTLPLIHLKLDTGMNRLGIKESELGEAMRVLEEVKVKLAGLATHFAESEVSSDFTDLQLNRFESMRRELGDRRLLNTDVKVHVGNSGAILRGKLGSSVAVRPGLSLYGISPNPELKNSSSLIPVMEWKTRVLTLKDLSKGESVGYNRDYVASGDERIALLPVGYADGIPRLIAEHGYVLAKGKRLPFRGRVSMDLIAVDATHVSDLREGEVVTLLGTDGGETLTIWDFAHWARTIPYEVFCNISPRVVRVYLD